MIRGYTNIDWILKSAIVSTKSGGAYNMERGGKLYKEGGSRNIDLIGGG